MQYLCEIDWFVFFSTWLPFKEEKVHANANFIFGLEKQKQKASLQVWVQILWNFPLAKIFVSLKSLNLSKLVAVVKICSCFKIIIFWLKIFWGKWCHQDFLMSCARLSYPHLPRTCWDECTVQQCGMVFFRCIVQEHFKFHFVDSFPEIF